MLISSQKFYNDVFHVFAFACFHLFVFFALVYVCCVGWVAAVCAAFLCRNFLMKQPATTHPSSCPHNDITLSRKHGKKEEKVKKKSPPSKVIKYQCKIWFRFVHNTLIKIPFQKNIYNWTMKLSSSVGVSTQRNALTLPFSDAIMSVMAPLLISDYVLTLWHWWRSVFALFLDTFWKSYQCV